MASTSIIVNIRIVWPSGGNLLYLWHLAGPYSCASIRNICAYILNVDWFRMCDSLGRHSRSTLIFRPKDIVSSRNMRIEQKRKWKNSVRNCNNLAFFPQMTTNLPSYKRIRLIYLLRTMPPPVPTINVSFCAYCALIRLHPREHSSAMLVPCTECGALLQVVSRIRWIRGAKELWPSYIR